MNYSTQDTEWATSFKGNTWKRVGGIALIVGKRKDGKWWTRRGDDFIKGSFTSKIEAMNAAELGHEGEADSVFKDDDLGR
jgi:hypothetical protein